MTHVQLRSHDGAYQLLVDGHDLSMDVLAGAVIELPTDHEKPALVHVTIAADTLDTDLPDAALTALREAAATEVVSA